MCYRGDFQVITDVHSVYVFLRDGVGTVQIRQQTRRLQTAENEAHEFLMKTVAAEKLESQLIWKLTRILLRRFIATGFSAVHSPTR